MLRRPGSRVSEVRLASNPAPTPPRQVYQRVTTRRRDPGLLEQDGEGSFSFKIFPVEPNENKRVEVKWSRLPNVTSVGAAIAVVAPL